MGVRLILLVCSIVLIVYGDNSNNGNNGCNNEDFIVNLKSLKEELADLRKENKAEFKELVKELKQVRGDGSCENTIGSFCTADDQCDGVDETECKWMTCKCKPGLSYHHESQQCLVDCGDFGYGDTYQEERNTAIRNLNNKVIKSVSLEECLDACTTETTFICRSIEYNSGLQQCQLTVETLYTASGDVYNVPPAGWDFFFTRNCS